MRSKREFIRLFKATNNWYDVVFAKLGLRKHPIIRFRDGLAVYYYDGAFSVEHFLERPYGCVNPKGRDVIDIGAYNADSALYFALQGAKTVYAFEPNPICYQIALKNLSLNRFRNIYLFNEGIGPYNHTIKLMDSRPSIGFVLKDSGENGVYAVRVRTLRSIIDEFNIDEAVLKLDCEGCEYDVLLNCEDDIFDHFPEIILEYHNGAAKLVTRLKEYYDIQVRDLEGIVITGDPAQNPDQGLLHCRERISKPSL
jgi:FkbM family methyltransferase